MPQLYDSLLERMGGISYTGYFSCLCPFHDDHKPSFFVYEESTNPNWEFRCASCGKHGSLVYLDKHIGSHFIPELRLPNQSRVLPKWRTWERKYGSLEGIAHAAHKNVNVTYLKRRKIYEFCEEGYLGTLDGWITFPVFDNRHNLCDIVVRSTSIRSGDMRYGVSPCVVGTHPLYVPSWKKVNESETIFVVYGIVDSISMHLAGLPVVTGTSGKSLSADLLSPLGKRFVIVPDADEEKEAHRLANQLGWRCRVKELKYDLDCKDPDDERRKFGNQHLLQLIGANV